MLFKKKQATIKVTTMKCANCAKRIENALKERNVSTKINLETKEVELYFKDGIITVDEVKKIITDLGYEVA